MVAREQSAVPSATIPMTRRSTAGVAGPRSTRSPRKSARRPSGWRAVSPSASDLVAELRQQFDQLGVAAVDVADDVERAVSVRRSFHSGSRSKVAASISSSPERT